MEATLSVTKKERTGELHLYVDGILDFSTMDAFIDEIREIPNEIEKVVIHFENLEFIDSTGIGAIINLVYEAQQKNFSVELEDISEENQLLFETIGVFEILEALQSEGA